MRRIIGLSAIIFVLLFFTGCAGITEDPTKNWSPERFYSEAKEKMADGNYETAIKHFETLEARYPYGRFAEQAQIEIAYAYYKYDEPALAIAAADRFIRLHPTHPNVDYAYYLKGLVNFRGEQGFVNWLLGDKDDLSDRDPKAVRESYDSFREVANRFPNSRYATDAKQRMAFLFEVQAKYETQIARFYFEHDMYVAAINRCKYSLENYPRTPATEDALGIMALAYKAIGMNDLMMDTRRVLAKNFPNSRYLAETSAQSASR